MSKLRVIYEPPLPDRKVYPSPDPAAAKLYRAGTVVEDERGKQWAVYWDEQDHQLEWTAHDPTEPYEEVPSYLPERRRRRFRR